MGPDDPNPTGIRDQAERDLGPAFWVEVQRDPLRALVVPHGELDLATIGVLDAELDETLWTQGREALLDLRNVTFIDSTGVSLVLRHANRRGPALAIIDGPPTVSRLFDITGVREALNFVAP